MCRQGIVVFIFMTLALTLRCTRPENNELAFHLVASGHAKAVGDRERNAASERDDGRENVTVEEVKNAAKVGKAIVAPEHSQAVGYMEGKQAAAAYKQMSLQAVTNLQRELRACADAARWARAMSSFLQLVRTQPVTETDPKAMQTANVNGKEMVSEKQCESATDFLKNLIEQERHAEAAAFIGGTVFFLLAIIFISIFIGTKLRPPPPGYWFNSQSLPWSFGGEFNELVDVTDKWGEAVQVLFDMTTRSELMGRGRDGAWATHKCFKVNKVMRIEHGRQWASFAHTRKHKPTVEQYTRQMNEACREKVKKTLETINDVFRERWEHPVLGPFLRHLDLDSARTELLLFHGSPRKGARCPKTDDIMFPDEDASPLQSIKNTGFDERLGSIKGMLGSGTYFADMASKGDQYAGRYNESKDGSVGEEAAMFLARVVMGCPYMTQQSLEQLRRPPCLFGHFDFNLNFAESAIGTPWHKKGLPIQVCDHARYDSVISDLLIDGDTKSFREYVVYEKLAYPEFIVFYERLAEGDPRNTAHR